MYKNWKAICEVPDAHFRWALALLDLTTNFGQNVVDQLPEYFTAEVEEGPIPMSVLKAHAVSVDGYSDCFVTDKVCDKFNIPYFRYSLPKDPGGEVSRPIPPEFKHLENLGDLEGFGTIIEDSGKKLVLIESCTPEALYFAPLERIALDL